MNLELNSREIHMLIEAIMLALNEIEKLDPNDGSLASQLLKSNKEGYERLKEKIIRQQ